MFMSYTGSKAGIGFGTVIKMGANVVGEMTSVNLTGRQAVTEETTNFQSSGKEFKPTVIDFGTWEFTGNRVGGDAGQVALEAAFTSLALQTFTIQLPKSGAQTTTGDLFTFSALIEEIDYNVDATKVVKMTGKLKVSGAITVTPGS
jgi:hypothetical protein